MQPANASKELRAKADLRKKNAVSFARAAFARAEYLPAMRMRMHAQQAKAAAAALSQEG